MGSNFHKAMPPSMIAILFGIKNPYKKCDTIKMQFIQDLVLFITKVCLVLLIFNNP